MSLRDDRHLEHAGAADDPLEQPPRVLVEQPGRELRIAGLERAPLLVRAPGAGDDVTEATWRLTKAP